MGMCTLYIDTKEKEMTKEDAEQIMKLIAAYFVKPEMIRGCE